ncbi:hypothetical protein [Sphingomonas sp. GC_Shp_3]|uniref:hypothetical protein n=1 Tax=Sphingomonas sp. GC_Shp_3 TaxID=2937383 RepID=UPI00226A6B9D|nr:hypothetical protein [Sphingomonas sp. GC_Shp_3]
MKPYLMPLERHEAHIIHRQNRRCPRRRRPMSQVTRSSALFAGGMALGFAIVAVQGNLEAALRALFGL